MRMRRIGALAVGLLAVACGGKEPEGAAPKTPAAESAASPATPKADKPAAAAETSPAPEKSGDPFPPSGPDAAWFVVTWDGAADSAEAALRGAGVDVARDANAHGGFTSLKGEREGWTIAAYYDAPGKKLTNIIVTSKQGSKEVGDASEARLRKRFGAPSTTVKATEHAWKRREGEPATATPGGLEWGMTPAKAESALKAIGFETKGNASPTTTTVASTKGDRSIFLSFGGGEGMTDAVMRCEGEPRFDEVQKALGNPRSTTRSTTTKWSTPGGDVELYVDDKTPGGAWMVRETYARKKTRS